MTPYERVVILIVLAVVLAVLIAGTRWWLRRRLRTLRRASASAVLETLAVTPDERPIVVAFSSPGCAVCRTAQRPALRVLQEISPEQPRVISIDVSLSPRVAEVFGVLTVPSTVVLTPRGQVLTANHGFAEAETLREQVRLAAAG